VSKYKSVNFRLLLHRCTLLIYSPPPTQSVGRYLGANWEFPWVPTTFWRRRHSGEKLFRTQSKIHKKHPCIFPHSTSNRFIISWYTEMWSTVQWTRFKTKDVVINEKELQMLNVFSCLPGKKRKMKDDTHPVSTQTTRHRSAAASFK